MKSWIQILGTDTVDVTPSIIVHYDSQRYLFNCGEGTQRLFVEKGVKFGKMQHVFCTRVDWECIGGLPGMLLTVSDAGINKLTLHGGPNLTHFIVATRHFIYRSTMHVTANEFKDAEPYVDENMRVYPVMVYPEYAPVRKRSADVDDEQAKEIRLKLLKTMFGSALRAQQAEQCDGVENEVRLTEQEQRHLPKTKPSKTVVCYVCHGPDVRGKFNPKAAKALGLKPGALFRELTEGKAVTAPDGSTIHPHQVMGDTKRGSIFVIVDCPSVDYIASVVAHPFLSMYQRGEIKDTVGGVAQCVVHLLGEGVLDDARYQQWINSFPTGTRHIVDSKEYNPQQMQYNTSASSQAKLSLLDNKTFPLAFHDQAQKDYRTISLKVDHRQAEPLLMVQLEPVAAWDRSAVLPSFSHEEALAKGRALPQYMKAVADSQSTLPAIKSGDITEQTMLTTLGTGSALPSKYRNVSGNMLTIPQVGTLLLDAGEGSYGQLYRHLGPESHSASWFANEYLPFSVDDCLRQLTFIFVSHLHADHHLGIVRILIKWNQVMQRDADARRTSRTSVIHMVAPLRFWTWLQEYAQVEELGLQYVKFYNAHDLLYYAPKQKPAAMLQALNMLDVGTTEVIHCPYAYAISLTSKDGFKFVYSGDTRPCDKLIQLGQSATVLLHEATFEDDMAQEALDKRHSTTGEAIHVAEQSNAKSLLLTHFSQRYPRVPVLPASATSQQRTSIAFDLMTVPLDRMLLLPRYIHSLQVLWQEDVKPEEEERL